MAHERGFFASFILGGAATSGACVISNPMEVVKTRMQLQGELAAKGAPILYRNSFQAFISIFRTEGFRGIQRGIIPGMMYQTFMNGTRLGVFEPLQKLYGAVDPTDSSFIIRNIFAGASAGVVGGVIGSPFFLVKARIQAASHVQVINSQYQYSGMFNGFQQILRSEGLRGLYRGVTGAMPRLAVGSATQLASYSSIKHSVLVNSHLQDGFHVHFICSFLCGLLTTTAMNPFDVVSTRLYSQKVTNGVGSLYAGVFDCFQKTIKSEGFHGLMKGWTAHYFRLGPHTVATFVFWEQLKRIASDNGW